MKNSKVHLSGEVIEIDYEKRDVKIKPINDSIITVHMWTTLSDDTGFWRSEDEWRDYVEVGSYITLNGYLGNNGRIITNPGNVWVNDQLLSHNTVEVTGILRDDAVIETKEQCIKETQSIIEEYKAKLQAEFDAKSKELEEQIAKYKEIIENGKVSEISKE